MCVVLYPEIPVQASIAQSIIQSSHTAICMQHIATHYLHTSYVCKDVKYIHMCVATFVHAYEI